MKVYTIDEIQKVFKQHAFNCGSVVYSKDNGVTWQSAPVDTGKWDIARWKFAFIA